MKKNDIGGAVFLFIVICAVFYSCSGNNTDARSSLPTIEPSATLYKPPLATKTKQISLEACVTSSTIRIRENPGTEFDVVGGLTSGTCFMVLGRNKDASWVYIETGDNVRGWVAAWLITVDGNVNNVAVTSNIISSTPTPNFAGNQPLVDTQLNKNENTNCLAAYTSVCIPPGRDLDCKDIPFRRFQVLGSDPFNFDADGDGIGCE